MANLKLLFVSIPEIPEGAAFTHHPFSVSQAPKLYKPEDLTDSGTAPTQWLGFFEEIFMGIFWKYNEPVPYVFKTANGAVRSLDAGCVKWLMNRRPPEISLILASKRIIEAVRPTEVLIKRYLGRKQELIDRVSSQRKSQTA